MGPFIASAQHQTQQILSVLADQSEADLRVGVVGYRDYGHAGEVLDVFGLQDMTERGRIAGHLQGLRAFGTGNPDAAEAVFAGVVAALGLAWRPGAMRVIVLVGDAPPHGCGADLAPFPDRHPVDPSGRTLQSLAAEIEGLGITLYSLGMLPSVHPQYDPITRESFTFLARSTGGLFAEAIGGAGAMKVLDTLGRRAFGALVVDRRVFELLETQGLLQPGPGAPAPAPAAMAATAARLNVPEEKVIEAVGRLQKRKILE
jgi:hypothetical protein